MTPILISQKPQGNTEIVAVNNAYTNSPSNTLAIASAVFATFSLFCLLPCYATFVLALCTTCILISNLSDDCTITTSSLQTNHRLFRIQDATCPLFTYSKSPSLWLPSPPPYRPIIVVENHKKYQTNEAFHYSRVPVEERSCLKTPETTIRHRVPVGER